MLKIHTTIHVYKSITNGVICICELVAGKCLLQTFNVEQLETVLND